MAIFKSGNPVVSDKTFDKHFELEGHERMTIRGTINKFGLMTLMLVAAASFTWGMAYKGENVMPWMWGSMLGGFVLALVMTFKTEWSPYLALGYALLQGLFLGAISAIFNAAFAESYPGIVSQAVLLTLGTAAGMFFLYYFRIIRATNTFKKVIILATAGIMIFYVISLVLRLFGIQMPLLHDSSPLGIGISLFIVAIAALNLILDFDRIENGAEQGAPKYFEWFCAFGLMVTIIWLYLEILRLLSKLASRD